LRIIKGRKSVVVTKAAWNWWSAPGGKMEQGESIKDSVIREFREETGIYLSSPKIKGVFTFIIKEGHEVIKEWMMFTFFAEQFSGENVTETEEGTLAWHSVQDIHELPMAPGDYHIIDYMIKGSGTIYGTFTYTPEFELISYRLDPQPA